MLVSAPAGYGKTTLLALWRDRDERPFAWISLDTTDNDPVALAAGVNAALAPLVQLDGATREALNFPEAPLEKVVLPSLVDACTAARQPFVLVIDDLHLVTEGRCHKMLGYLAEHLPAGCILALSTRTDPQLPLASWRAHGRLIEVRAAELALGHVEACALLAAADVRLADDQVAQLVERTEGWPAALYLAALSLRGRPYPEGFVDRFAGTSRHVADFLTEDVLARQPEGLVGFLLGTSVLEELTASLCDALTGGPDASDVLRELERCNLFVVPLDEERRAYRYHHLFGQYLRAELARREAERVPELHRRAWRWYRSHGLVGRAVTHAQAAGDIDVAADLVAAEWLPMVEHGQVETVRSWISGFPRARIEQHAPLAIAVAWVASLAGDGERAARFAEAALHGSWDGPMPDGTASLESALAIMSSAFGLGGVPGMRRAAQRAVDLELEAGGWRALALLLLGVAHTLEGNFANARVTLNEAVELSRGETSTGTTSLAYLALISLREGDEEQAFRHALRAHAVVERPRMCNYVPSICTYTIVAAVLGCRGDLEGAALAVDRANALLPRLTGAYWWQMIVTRILLAPVLASLGRGTEAERFVEEAETLLAEHDDAGLLPDWHAESARHLRRPVRREHRSRALSAAERRVLRLLASDLTLRENGQELFLSANTVKTHKRSIYRKLGVSSREEAVKAGRSESPATRSNSPG